MVSVSPVNAPPIDLAAAIGRRLATVAVTADEHATWLTDEIVPVGEVWQRRSRTLSAGLASGTAGVGWALARLAAATGDQSIARVALEAIRHALASLDAMIGAGELGFHDGAAGVAWAAREASLALERQHLDASAAKMRVVEAMRRHSVKDLEPGLARGLAGLLTGVLRLSDRDDEAGVLETASPIAGRLCACVSEWTDAGVPPSRAQVGLLHGASGIGAALMSWSDRTSDAAARRSAEAAFRLERAWHDDGIGWFGGDAARPRSWIDGASGIGLARVWAHAATGEYIHLAEAGAAIETLRAVPVAEVRDDASLGGGAAGHVELLVSAGSILKEPAHAEAARRMMPRMLAPCPDPALISGAAGVLLTLLRLHDPAVAPSPLMPPLPRGAAVTGG